MQIKLEVIVLTEAHESQKVLQDPTEAHIRRDARLRAPEGTVVAGGVG